jgi:hypothetical protein
MSRVARLLTRDVTLLEPTSDEVDDYGQPVVTVVEHPTKCHYRRIRTDDQAGVGVIVTEDIEVYLSTDDDVESTWGVRLGEATYEVVGEVTPVWNARTGTAEYRSVICRRSGT